MSALPYLTAWIFPPLAASAVLVGGWWSFNVPVIAFGLIPVMELALSPRPDNVSDAALDARARRPNLDRVACDWLLYLLVPAQVALVGLLMWRVGGGYLGAWGTLGAILSVGMCCGVFGINGGHELGHREKRYERRMAQVLLTTTLYTHFFIEHNRGHHRRVATPEDPATSRRGETLYAFWLRSTRDSWLHAWVLDRDQMARFTALQIALLAAAAAAFGPVGVGAWVLASLVGALLLETVNYVEHYGLLREKNARGHYERVRPEHSWNSNHPVGRALLFELPRHSDHHAHPNRPFPALRHFEESPQLPTGYPGMMLLAAFPPLWFRVMGPHLDRWSATRQAA